MKRNLLFVFTLLLINFASIAQQNAAPAKNPGAKYSAPAIGRIYGKVIDSKSGENMPFTSVAILKNDTVINGCLTKDNGEFSIEKLPFGKFNLKIIALGYKKYLQQIIITPQNAEQDMGNIKIEVEASVIKEVEVSAEKSASEINIDRKVFNVDKNITSKGGTATDVMKNFPSVTLDASGNVLLRQNAATIYVDGRPTLLTLDQIPADQIDRVEVITNPSAKYEASATGGILNIVMKSNNLPGYNGIVTGGIGTNDHYNGMVVFNIKQKPFALSTSYIYNTFDNPVNGYTNRTNLSDGNQTGYYNTNSTTRFQNTFQTANAALDYFLNNRNTLTFSENMVMGDFHTNSDQNFYNGTINGSKDSMTSYGTRLNPVDVHFQLFTEDLHYKKTFPKKDKEFTMDVKYTDLNAHSTSTYTTSIYDPTGILQADNPQLQNNLAHTNSGMFNAQADFVDPINDSTKLELGVRSNNKPSTQNFDVSEFNYTSMNYEQDAFLTNHYNISYLVNAAYANYTARLKHNWSYALGLRVESSFYMGSISNKNDTSFQYLYPSNLNNIMNALFPSLFITKKLNEKQEWQFNISRKINRPNFMQLMPFIQASDAKDYTIGNPSLTPEFVTMAELNFNQQLNKGNLFFTLFYRNSQNPLTSYTGRAPSDSTILVTTTINGKQSNTIGFDNTFKYTFFKTFEVTLNMNLFYTFIQANYNNISVSNQGFYYNGKINFVQHLPKDFTIQLSGNYESPKIIPQGTAKEIYFADFGFSKSIHHFITLTLSVSDIFDTKGFGSSLLTDEYSQQVWGRREGRYIKFTAMIRFGKADASFRKKPAKPDDSDAIF